MAWFFNLLYQMICYGSTFYSIDSNTGGIGFIHYPGWEKEE
jgi:hypothetical protein